jgi:hypothetical protein
LPGYDGNPASGRIWDTRLARGLSVILSRCPSATDRLKSDCDNYRDL